MHILRDSRAISRPGWDGSRVTFQIVDRDTLVDCAISRAALLDIAQRNHLPADGWMACFLKSRARIEAIALAKFLGRSRHVGGILHIWSEDIDPAPPNMPVAACGTTIRQSA